MYNIFRSIRGIVTQLLEMHARKNCFLCFLNMKTIRTIHGKIFRFDLILCYVLCATLYGIFSGISVTFPLIDRWFRIGFIGVQWGTSLHKILFLYIDSLRSVCGESNSNQMCCSRTNRTIQKYRKHCFLHHSYLLHKTLLNMMIVKLTLDNPKKKTTRTGGGETLACHAELNRIVRRKTSTHYMANT